MEPSERAFLQDESWRVAQDRLERKQTGQAETIVIQGGYGNGSK
jgi:hypothetical protein